MVEEGWPNVSGAETAGEDGGSRWRRAGSAALGGALLTVGLRRRSPAGTAVALLGGLLAYRAIGRGRLRRAVGGDSGSEGTTVERTATVGADPGDLSERLRDPETLGAVAGHFAEVTAAGEDRHRWTVDLPGDRDLSWETRLAEDVPGERLRWETVEGTGLFAEWTAAFRPDPGGRGTQVSFRVRFAPPGGRLGTAAVERLEAAPETLVGDALRRFKSLAETGEVPTLEGNPSARGRGDLA